MSGIRVILGTMEIGRRVTPTVATEMVSTFLSRAEYREIDTASMYADTATESILGGIEQWKENGKMATKINPWGPNVGAKPTKSHGFSYKPDALRQQVENSLDRLNVDNVDILYLHAPDHNTSPVETLEELAKLKQDGKFSELGLSNYSSWLTCEMVNVAKQYGFPIPTVYQGH